MSHIPFLIFMYQFTCIAIENRYIFTRYLYLPIYRRFVLWAGGQKYLIKFVIVIVIVKAFIQNLVQNGLVVLRKSGLNFCMYTTLGQGQVMTLTFNTHIPS